MIETINEKKIHELLHKEFKLDCKPSKKTRFENFRVFKLVEVDSNAKNDCFEIHFNRDNYSVAVFKSDIKDKNLLQYFFNHEEVTTNIPDYIVFIEDKQLQIYTIIVEMKSNAVDNRVLKNKFRNGQIIAEFITKIVRGKAPIKHINLLSKQPKLRKLSTNRGNDHRLVYKSELDGYQCQKYSINVTDHLLLSTPDVN